MQEHLIPQDITNYQFHLIGELNLKQFGEIMVGIIIAILINQTNWPSYIKWPLIIFFGGLGLMAAFLPIGGMPLSHWIDVFFKNLFAPTKFYWRKTTEIPSFFNYELPDKNRQFLESTSTFNATPAKKHRALAYFTTLGETSNTREDPLEIFTNSNVVTATNDFIQNSQVDPAPTPTPVSAPTRQVIKPQVDNSQSIRQRQIITPTQESLEAFLQTNSIFKPTNVTEQITSVDDQLAAATSASIAAANEGQQPTADTLTQSGLPVDIQFAPTGIPATTPASVATFQPMPSPVMPVSQSPDVSQLNSDTITPLSSPLNSPVDNSAQTSVAPITAVNAPVTTTVAAASEITNNQVTPVTPDTANSYANAIVQPPTNTISIELPNTAIINPVETASVVTGKPLPTPTLPPQKTSKLTGLVTDNMNRPLANVIINLQDRDRNSKVIVRSDEQGQFTSPQAIQPGDYIVSSSKDDYIFPEMTISVDNQGVKPLLLRSQ